MEKPLPEVTYGRGLGPARVSPQSQRGIYLKIKAVARRVKIVRNKAVVTA